VKAYDAKVDMMVVTGKPFVALSDHFAVTLTLSCVVRDGAEATNGEESAER
jgi:hypothetical protein